jgi:hypothetical protein
MGMLFSKPKYTPPPELEETKRAVAEREASAEAQAKKETAALAARRRATRTDPRSLLGSGGLLGIQETGPQPTEQAYRDPFQTGRFR